MWKSQRITRTLVVATLALGASCVQAASTSLRPDAQFGAAGVSVLATPDYESFVASLSTRDGSVIAVGNLGTARGSDLLIARFRADGSLDPAFGLGGQSALDLGAADDAAHAGLALTDGRLLVAGRSSQRPVLVAFRADGSLDTTFGQHGRLSINLLNASGGILTSLTRLADGSVLAGGEATVSGQQQPLLVRIGTDGALRRDFDLDGVRVLGELRGTVGAVAPTPDGGAFVATSGGEGLHVVRVGADGRLVAGFGVAGIASVPVVQTAPLADLVLDGADLLLAERARGRLTRLAADGRVLDQRDLLASGELAALARLPDGALVAGLERPKSGRIVAEVVILERASDGARRLGAGLELAVAGDRLAAVRGLDASQPGRVRLAGFRYSADQTDAWVGSLTVSTVSTAPAVVASQPPVAAVAVNTTRPRASGSRGGRLPKYCSKPKLPKKKARRCGRA